MGANGQTLKINHYKHSNLKIIPVPSIQHVDYFQRKGVNSFFFHNCPLLNPSCNIPTLSLIYVTFESTLLNYANPCRYWTFQSFARVAEKKERNGINEKSDTR